MKKINALCLVALFAPLLILADLPTPLIHWTFDGGSATNCGSGGPVYDAVLKGTAYELSAGLLGGGLHVYGTTNDATRGYAEVAHTYGQQGSVAFWYKPDRFYDYNSILDNSVHENWWEMWIHDNSTAVFRIRNDGSTNLTPAPLNHYNGSNHWYHFAITWDFNAPAQIVSLYVNGLVTTNVVGGTWVDPGQYIYFGGGHSHNHPGSGCI